MSRSMPSLRSGAPATMGLGSESMPPMQSGFNLRKTFKREFRYTRPIAWLNDPQANRTWTAVDLDKHFETLDQSLIDILSKTPEAERQETLQLVLNEEDPSPKPAPKQNRKVDNFAAATDDNVWDMAQSALVQQALARAATRVTKALQTSLLFIWTARVEGKPKAGQKQGDGGSHDARSNEPHVLERAHLIAVPHGKSPQIRWVDKKITSEGINNLDQGGNSRRPVNSPPSFEDQLLIPGVNSGPGIKLSVTVCKNGKELLVPTPAGYFTNERVLVRISGMILYLQLDKTQQDRAGKAGLMQEMKVGISETTKETTSVSEIIEADKEAAAYAAAWSQVAFALMRIFAGSGAKGHALSKGGVVFGDLFQIWEPPESWAHQGSRL